jgi:hypothetical protein
MSAAQSVPDFTLTRDAFGRLVLHRPGQAPRAGVVPVRAFPIAAPDEGLSVLGSDGRELAWIDRLADLPTDIRSLIEQELAEREFMPVIHRIKTVSSFSTPSTWEVDTDRGATSFVLKGEEDIRRLGGPRLMIASGEGLHFVVADVAKLDRNSKRLLERFL